MTNKIGAYWLKSGFFALLGRSSNTLFAFIAFLILVKTLDPSELGVWSLYVSVCSFLELWKSGFVGNPLIRFASGEVGRKYSEIITSSLILNTSISVIQILVLFALAPFLSVVWESQALIELFYVYMVSSLFLILQSHFTYLQQANFTFVGGFWSNLARQLCFFGFLAASYLFNYEYSLFELAISQSAGAVMSTFIAYLFGKEFNKVSTFWSKDMIFKLLNFGKFTFGTNLGSTILRNIDSWMLGYLISTAAVGIYNPALRLSNLFELPTATLTSVSFPKLVQRIKSEGASAAKYLYEKSMGLIMAVIIPVVLVTIIFAEEIILIIAGSEYVETIDILRITMLYGLIIPFNRQVGITLDALGKPKVTFLFVIRNALINMVLNYFFIQFLGIIGAALATLTTFIFVLIYNQIYINNLIGVKILRVFEYMFEFYVLGFNTAKSVLSGKQKT